MSVIRVLAGAALALSAGLAQAADGKLVVELNKFEAIEGGGCSAYFLFRNTSGVTLEGFQMALAVLDSDGVIDRLLTVDAAPLPDARTTLKLFEMPEIQCEAISEVLLHDVETCKPQNEDEIDCFPILDLVSRTGAQLVK